MNNIDKVNIGSTSLDPSYGVQGKDQVRVGQNGQNSSARGDSVVLSSTAQDVDRFTGLIGQTRESNIDRVRQMIQAGTYNVSGQDIAQKLIQSNWK
jgi:anti-sigma28 factor (negative regulator of flagellin synthesis)